MLDEIRRWVKRVFCFHKWKYHVVNIQTEGSTSCLTMAWKDCNKCGHSRIDFTYGN